MGKNSNKPLIGIVFDYNKTWMGGTYYILNVLNAIASLPQKEQPSVIIYGENEEGFNIVKKNIPSLHISYVRISTLYRNIFPRLLNKIYRLVAGKNLFVRYAKPGKQVIFPGSMNKFFSKMEHQLFWIPDLQEKYYPGFFSAEDLQFREKYNRTLIQKKAAIVFSSKTALNDFKKFYPENNNPSHLLPFAVSLPDTTDIDLEAVKEKFLIRSRYFITPNQFWVHKNHGVIIEAASILKEKGYQCEFLFSGMEHDPRAPQHSDNLKRRIVELGLQSSVRFLGFLDRKELLKLIEGSVAVLQPSLFEGWSTVIEDGKALSKNIIASDIPVHYEQMGDMGRYFDPTDPIALSEKIIEILHEEVKSIDWQYGHKRMEFGKRFLEIVKQVSERGST